MRKLLLLTALMAFVLSTAALGWADTESSIEVGRMEQEVARTQEQLDKIREENAPAGEGDYTSASAMPSDEWDYSVDD